MAPPAKTPGCTEGCLNVTAKCLLEGDVAQAEHWLDAMEGASRTANSKVFYHSLIHRCAQAGSPEAAGWCVDRMVRRQLKANLVTFNSVIDACARVGNVDLASRWFEEIAKAQLKPNGITYNTMIKACAKAHDPAMAELWLHRMQQDGLLPCIVSFSTVIDALAKTGDMEKAELWYHKMVGAGVDADAVIFNTLINASAKALQPEKAEGWLKELLAHGLAADEKTYNSLLNAFARVGDVRKAEFWFHEMERSGCAGDKMLFGCVIHACAKAGDLARAEQWVESMMRRGLEPNLFCLNTILQACVHDRSPEKADKWFGLLLASGEADQVSYHNLVEAHAAAGDLRGAESRLQRMVAAGFGVNHLTYTAMVRGCGAAFDRCAGDPSQWAYEAIVRAYCTVGHVTPAHHWLTKMAAVGVAPSAGFVDECVRLTRSKAQGGSAPELERMIAAARAFEARGFQGGKGSRRPWAGVKPSGGPQKAKGQPQREEAVPRVPMASIERLPSVSTAPPSPGRTQELAESYVPSSGPFEDLLSTPWMTSAAAAMQNPPTTTVPARSADRCSDVALAAVLTESGYTAEQQRTMSIQRLSF